MARRARRLAPLCALLAACGAEPRTAAPRTTSSATADAAYVDESGCVECHENETVAWRGSDHDRAMDVATPETVLGDFDDASLEHALGTAHFRRDGDAFVIRTTGADGADRDFRVAYVFGVEPLQQYLVEFPSGALQACDLAWDVDEQRWFDLTPDEPDGAADPLHWTGPYQRWNAMCAECHSTALDKALDVATGTYATHWERIDVGCQACHGPAAGHLAWLDAGRGEDEPARGFARPLRRGDGPGQLESCAPCHSRRASVAPLDEDGTFLDRFEPAPLRAGLYHADGQVLDEVYVWGSFVQSKMAARGVACTDCHDAHSTRLVLQGDALCMQCHTSLAPQQRFPSLRQKDYDTPEHHHHPVESDGARCVACHMPEHTFMRIDERSDHSFRVPRPDLSVALGTPNACSGCHTDHDDAWAAERVEEWYGPREDAKPHHAFAITAGRIGDPRATALLADVALDPERPAIVRATVVELLEAYGEAAVDALVAALEDPDPLVRATAARSLGAAPLQRRVTPLLPLLDDPVRIVRLHAARSLAELKVQSILPERERERLEAGLAEFRAAQEYAWDLPGPHLNVGRLHEELREPLAAAREYERALEIDPWFVQASFNLTGLLNQLGRNAEAEAALRDALQRFPDSGELHYSLGLLLAEMQRMEEAEAELAEAARLVPGNPRIHYNRGLVLRELDRDGEAENALLAAYARTPNDPRVVHALALLYEEGGALDAARRFAGELVRLDPRQEAYRELLRRIEQASGLTPR